MTIYNIKKGQKVFVVKGEQIIEGEITDFLSSNNSEEWEVSLYGGATLLKCNYREDAFFTQKNALYKLTKSNEKKNEELRRKENELLEKHREYLETIKGIEVGREICSSCKKPINDGLCGCS
jgi:hypothetical protein